MMLRTDSFSYRQVFCKASTSATMVYRYAKESLMSLECQGISDELLFRGPREYYCANQVSRWSRRTRCHRCSASSSNFRD